MLNFKFQPFIQTVFIASLDLETTKADTIAILLNKSLHFEVPKWSGRYL